MPRGSIADAQKRSIPSESNEKPLVLLGSSNENQLNQGFEEWAIQDSNQREYIGIYEQDGSVVLRVVLSDSITEDQQRVSLLQAVVRLTGRMTTSDLEAVVKLCRQLLDQ